MQMICSFLRISVSFNRVENAENKKNRQNGISRTRVMVVVVCAAPHSCTIISLWLWLRVAVPLHYINHTFSLLFLCVLGLYSLFFFYSYFPLHVFAGLVIVVSCATVC